MNRTLPYAAFFVGLAAVCWVAIGYIGSNPLAFAITLLIAAFYLMGGLELRRFQQASATLTHALTDMPEAPASLGQWLGRLHPSLQNAVRLRVEGERVGLPGPALAPYLAGLLVLLGMLGTFLGMVVTLKGTGTALESASDLLAIRSSLAAPVKGLGVAFGTSLAGVATSAMLGLVSALCRRDRLQAAQLLDTRIATTLRVFSLAHQREESFKLLQAQGQAMPAMVDRLQAMMAAMERQTQALNERLIAGQDSFHGKAEAVYAGLASSVDRSLRESLAESARIAGATVQPVVEATMAGIARETASLHDTVSRSVQQQLEGLSSRFEASTATVAELWQNALAGHQRVSEAQSGDLRASLDHFAQTFERRSAALVDGVSARLERTVSLHDTLSHSVQQQLAGLSSRFEASTAAVAELWQNALAGHQRVSEAQSGDLRHSLDRFTQTFEQRSAALVDGVSARLEGTVGTLSDSWRNALAQHERTSESLAADTQRALTTAAAGFEQHSASLLHTVGHAHTELQTQMASADQQRLAAWTQSLEAMAASLQQAWQQAGARSESQQQDICKTLALTASEISAQTEAHARSTIAEIGQLVQAASQAPRAAAEVIAELRQKLTDSMASDNAMLEERSRILGTLETLLDAVNHASTEQRAAIDALVGTSADLLDRVGTRFTDQVDAEAGKMAAVAAQITGSAVEVASLGEAFGLAVQLFSQSSDKLGAQLQRIEGALGKSTARSDEQLAYYVAQAREVVDLSILSQKQIVEDLQQLAIQRAAVGSEA